MHKPASFADAAKPKNTTPRVFVLETKQNVDITKAVEHGPIVPIFDSTQRNPKFVDEDFIDEILDRLHDGNYNPCVDFLLIVGHMPSTCILVGSVVREFVETEKDFVKLLVWNTWCDRYICIEI